MTLLIPFPIPEPDPATPIFGDKTVVTVDAGTSAEVAVPTGTTEGDRLVLAIAKTEAATFTGLTGWTQTMAEESVPGAALYVYEKAASAADADHDPSAPTYTPAWTGADDAVIDMINVDQCGASTFSGTDFNQLSAALWSLVGTGLSISGAGIPALAPLNATDVAFFDGGIEELRRYRWDAGTETWSLVGTGLSIGGAGSPGMAALNENDVVHSGLSNGDIGLYRWDVGTETWSLVGTPLHVTSQGGRPAFAVLNETDVAYFNSIIDQLRLYRWDSGTETWSLVGTGLSIGGAGTGALAPLNATDVAFFDGGIEELRRYRWDAGTGTWSLVGTGLLISGGGNPALAALNATDVAFFDSTLEELRLFRWDSGTETWLPVGNGLPISGGGNPALAAFNATDVAFFDGTLKELRRYRWAGYPICPEKTTGSANNFIVRAMACSGAPTVTEPAGTTSIASQASPNSLVTLAAAYEAAASAGDVGTAAFSLSAAQPWAAATVALRAGDENPTVPSYVLQVPAAVSTTFTYGGPPTAAEANLYDQTSGTYAADPSGLTASTHAAYDLGAAKTIRRVTTVTAGNVPGWDNTTVFDIQYSDTAISGPWTTVSGSATQHTITADSSGNPSTDTTDIDDNGAHRYWNIVYASGTTGGNAWLDELSVFTYE